MWTWVRMVALVAVMQPAGVGGLEPLALGHLLSICGANPPACGGYIVGVIDQYLVGDEGAICLPGNFDGSVAVVALSHYIMTDVREGAGLADPAPRGIIAAMKSSFPCARWFRHMN